MLMFNINAAAYPMYVVLSNGKEMVYGKLYVSGSSFPIKTLYIARQKWVVYIIPIWAAHNTVKILIQRLPLCSAFSKNLIEFVCLTEIEQWIK